MPDRHHTCPGQFIPRQQIKKLAALLSRFGFCVLNFFSVLSVVKGGQNLPNRLVGIGLTDLPKIGGGALVPRPHGSGIPIVCQFVLREKIRGD